MAGGVEEERRRECVPVFLFRGCGGRAFGELYRLQGLDLGGHVEGLWGDGEGCCREVVMRSDGTRNFLVEPDGR